MYGYEWVGGGGGQGWEPGGWTARQGPDHDQQAAPVWLTLLTPLSLRFLTGEMMTS